MANIKRQVSPRADKNVEQLELSYTAGGDEKGYKWYSLPVS